jgi:TolB-like protein/Flp pilus assembly protein TadD
MGGDGTQPRMTAQERPAGDRLASDRLANDRLANDRLDSWKEIAAYLNKEVRTVQRWEKSLGLPVRRLAQGKQGTVFAYKLDLDAWWQESQTKLEYEDDRPDARTGAGSDGSGVPGPGVSGLRVSGSGVLEASAGPGVSSSNLVVLASALDCIEKDRTDRDRSGNDLTGKGPTKEDRTEKVQAEKDQTEKDRRGKTSTADHRPDLIRRLTVLCLLIIVAAGVASVAARFWLQTPVGFPRAKMVLAIRPFRNMSGDPGQDFVADGLTEEMITRLGQLHPEEMGVIRLSPAYASSTFDRIGKEVRANYVLEGSVRQSGKRVAITAQLIQVSDQTQVWGESYERDLQDVLSIQAEVASAIAGGVLNKLPHAHPLVRQVNREAYLAYLEGRYFWNKRTEEGFSKAITLFKRSIEIDPTYAPPYAGLADCYELLGSAPYSTLSPKEAFPQAEAAARKALELDPTLAEAHVPLGYSELVYEWNLPEAQKEFDKALQLRPGYATAHQFYGYYLTAMGKLDDAIVERKKAVDLDPISPLLNSALAEAYYHARRFDVTIDESHKALELDPAYAIALVNIGRAYEQMGMHQQARDAFQTILAFAPDSPAILALMGHEYAVSGDMGHANQILARLTKLSSRKYVSAVYFALVYIGLGRKDDAFRWLEKAYDERCEYLVYLSSEPLADPLRGDPRFSSLMSRIGLRAASGSAEHRTQ